MKKIISSFFLLSLFGILNAHPMIVVEEAAGRSARPFKIKCQIDLGSNLPIISYSHVLYLIDKSESFTGEKISGKCQIIESEFSNQLKGGRHYLVKLDVHQESILMHLYFECSVGLPDKTLQFSKDSERLIPIGQNTSGKFSGLSFSIEWLEESEEEKGANLKGTPIN
jgi:hypothetical protein